MKKILLVAATLLLTFSMAFGERESGMDLLDMFGANQIGFGYNNDELDTSLYSDFGTDKLRFSVNVLELNTFYNNGQQVDNTSKVGMYGLPRFFVGAGYNMGAHRFALGYGLKKIWTETDGRRGWVGHDISLAWQGNFGANTFKFATPIQIGAGTGKTEYKVSGTGIYYENKNASAFAVAPQIRWLGKLGALTQIRFAVPYGAATMKDRLNVAVEKKTLNSSSIGADLRVYFSVATDPVAIRIIPRVRYETAIKGNNYAISPMGNNNIDGGNAIVEEKYDFLDNDNGDAMYSLERPWRLRTQVEFEMSAGNDFLDLWVSPTLKYNAVGAPKITYVRDAGGSTVNAPDGVERKEAFHSFGFYLPIELTFKINKNLNATIGMEADMVVSGVPSKKAFSPAGSVGGSVVWYF